MLTETRRETSDERTRRESEIDAHDTQTVGTMSMSRARHSVRKSKTYSHKAATHSHVFTHSRLSMFVMADTYTPHVRNLSGNEAGIKGHPGIGPKRLEGVHSRSLLRTQRGQLRGGEVFQEPQVTGRLWDGHEAAV